MRKNKPHKERIAFLLLTLTVFMGILLVPAKPASAASISLNKSKITLYAGDSSRLTVRGTSKTPSFKSSKPSVASVTRTGTVKAKKAGSCTITVKSSGKTLKCKVTVKKSLELSKYLNKDFSQLKKAAGKMEIKKDVPFPNPERDLYVSKAKDPYTFMFWIKKKDKKIQTIQNTGRKNITLYGVRLDEEIKSAHKKLIKKGFKLKNTTKPAGSNNPRKEIRTYTKSGNTIDVSVLKNNKIEYYQWSRQ